MSLELLLSVGALSVLDTLSPATLAVTVYLLLTARERHIPRLLVYLTTVAGFYFAVGVSLMLGLDTVIQSFTGLFQHPAISQAMTWIGIALVVISFFVPAKKKTNSWEPARRTDRSIGAMVILGFTTSLIEVATALPYFAAIGMMTAAKLTPMQWLPLLAGYNFVMIFPPLVLLGLHVLFGRWMHKPLEKLRVKLARSSGSALSWVMFIAGLILLLNA
ncbi:GAP family protein [Paenibacillus sp. J2TS4]|uniref:GAP family protein n=1 Tax=Paenibacillus sp. J2TS4 TaxID=2807194 RepID=UPI001B076148|nr:GAP family protein [Paenibacillus sp. J2TS4]GIP31786.1 hypothetical protein J2TS4_09960 [Paenibacillus sp. J2TS4]